jgi:NifU-like protein involved in Fe-S cluster formation
MSNTQANTPGNDPAEFDRQVARAIADARNMGEIENADAIGTVGSADCGDMLRMWVKFREDEGKRVIDQASFQSFGCQTAIAVASLATEMLKGKSVEEARNLSGQEMARNLGSLPPMKIHCAQMVEDALRQALDGDDTAEAASGVPQTGTGQRPKGNLAEAFSAPGESRKIVFDPPPSKQD